jgi:lysophospholipase L1-like esterase
MGIGRHTATLTLGVLLLATAWAPAAMADISFQWEMPERSTGVTTVARDVESAAKVPPPTVDLRSCAAGAAWKLDGDPVEPPVVRHCVYRLQLPDAEEHQVTLEADGESFTAPVRARDLLVVSIGDSVASGEGDPDGPSLFNPRWLETRCHRSLRSGAAQAALALEAGSPHSAVTFLPLACSGATIDRGLLGPFGGVQRNTALGDLPAQASQVARLQKLRRIDALLLSVGANDVYFGPLAEFCAAVERCPERRFARVIHSTPRRRPPAPPKRSTPRPSSGWRVRTTAWPRCSTRRASSRPR